MLKVLFLILIFIYLDINIGDNFNELRDNINIQLDRVNFYKNSYMIRYNGNITYNDWKTCNEDITENMIKISVILLQNEIKDSDYPSYDVRDINCDGNILTGLTSDVNITYFGVAIYDTRTNKVICSITKNLNTFEINNTCGRNSIDDNKLKTEHIVLIVIGSVIFSIIFIGCIAFCCIRWKKLNKPPKENNGIYGTLI